MGRKAINFVSRVSTLVNSFNVRGSVLCSWFTIVMIGLCIYSVIRGVDIPGGVLTAYGTVIGGLVVNKTVEVSRSPKAEK